MSCRRSKWFEGARDLIERSERKAKGSALPLVERLEWIENQIRSGEILLYQVLQDSKPIGIITGVVEREHGKPSNLLIVHAVSIAPQKTSYICTLVPLIHGLVKKSGLASWTVRSQRGGMDKRLEQTGFLKVETVYKRAV